MSASRDGFDLATAYADERRALMDPDRALPWDRIPSYGSLSGDTVYIGGSFTEVITQNGVAVARSRLAAINANTGKLTDWAPQVNRPVSALAVNGFSTSTCLPASRPASASSAWKGCVEETYTTSTSGSSTSSA